MTAIAALPPSVRSYVSDFVARARRLALARAVGLASAVFLGWALVCCALDRFVHFGPLTRLTLVGAGIIAVTIILFRPLRIARRREADVLDAAAEIERHEPRFGQRLVTVVSRLVGPPEHRGSDEILYRLLSDVSREAHAAGQPRPMPRRRVVLPWLGLFVLISVAALLMRVPDFGLPRLLLRFVVPLADLEPVTTTLLTVTPGSVDVMQSQPLRIEVTARRLGEGRTVWVWLREEGGDWLRRPMAHAGDSDDRYRFTLSAVERDLSYYVAGGDATTRQFRVRSLRPPAAAEFRIRYVYPPYASRPPLTVTNTDGLIEAPAGTEATVTVVATEPLQAAFLTISGEKLMMSRTDQPNVRRASFRITRPGPYTLDMISTRDIPGGGPAGMFVHALSDQKPLVRLLQAGQSPRLNPRDILPLSYQVLDDFGLAAVTVKAQVNGGAPPVDVPVPIAGDARRQEGTFNLDLATMKLAVGDLVTVTLFARDRAGQQATSEPMQVLLAPRSVDLATYERIGELESAAQLSGLVVEELEATARAIEEAQKERGANADAESAAVGRANRSLTTATDTAVLMRQSLLRSIVRSATNELSTTLASVVDSSQILTAAAEVLFRSNDMTGGGAPGATPVRDRLEALLGRARLMRNQLKVVAEGERAAALLADRENLASSEKKAAAAGSAAVERLRRTLLRAKEEVDANVKRVGLEPAAADLDARLKVKVEAGAALLRSQQPVDLAAAAGEWSAELQKDPLRRMVFDERLAAAAQAEAIRPDCDLPRARDLQLCARAAARLASDAASDKYAGRPVNPERPTQFAAAVAALQREHEINRRPADVRPPAEAAAIHQAAQQSRVLVAQWAGDAAAPAVATTTPATALSPSLSADLRARQRRAEDLALRAGAETALRDYEAARASDRELHRNLAEPLQPAETGAAAAQDALLSAGPPLPPSLMRPAQRVERLTNTAEKIDHIQTEQDRLADETKSGDAHRSTVLAGRQLDVAERIADAGSEDPSASPAHGRRNPEEPGDDPNWRGRATATLLKAQEQLASMPQELTRAQEAAAALRQAAARAEMAKREAAAAPPGRRPALDRAARQAEQERADSEERLRAISLPVAHEAADALASMLAPFEPESTVVREIVSRQLGAALSVLEQASRGGDAAAEERAAAEARGAIDAAQKELARAQQMFTERDPLIAAKWFARAAADSLQRSPPDLSSAYIRQRDTSVALSRAWDRTIHQATAQRLALLPSMQSLYGVPVPPPALAQGTSPGGEKVLPPVPDLASVREWGRFRPRETEDLVAPLRESEPPGYEKALQLYFQKVGQVQEQK